MKQLTCEMCGSTNLVKQEGVFVCQECGTKYSVEEARKMMSDGSATVTNTVRVDDTDRIKNYLEMAESAYESENLSEAESYCNRIIEINPQNSTAWLIKGKSAGWQSTLVNLRIEETVQCFSKAIDYADENMLDNVKKEATNELSRLAVSLATLCCNNFKEVPNKNNCSDIISKVKLIIGYETEFLLKCGIEAHEHEKLVAALVVEAASDVFVRTNSALKSANVIKGLPHPEDDMLIKLLNIAEYCEQLILAAISYDNDDYKNNIQRYELLKQINDICLKAKSYKIEIVNAQYDWVGSNRIIRSYSEQNLNWYLQNFPKDIISYDIDRFHRTATGGYVKYFTISKSASESLANTMTGNIRKYEQTIKEFRELLQKGQQERIDAYWAEHAEEKQQLLNEQDSLRNEAHELEQQRRQLTSEIDEIKKQRNNAVPAEKEKDSISSEISRLRQEMNGLGLFKTKEKKALSQKIEECNNKLTEISERVEEQQKEQRDKCNAQIKEVEERKKPLEIRIDKIYNRIRDIKIELEKDR